MHDRYKKMEAVVKEHVPETEIGQLLVPEFGQTFEELCKKDIKIFCMLIMTNLNLNSTRKMNLKQQ